jgi:hypothetical protein
MSKMKDVLVCALLASMTLVAVYAVLLIREATTAMRAVPAWLQTEVQATRADLVGQLADARSDITAQIEGARTDALTRTERQVAALQSGVLQEVGLIRQTADRRLGDTLARADTALAQVAGLRSDLKPAIDGAVALETDAKDSWDDMYWDVKALVGSATVAARGVAETSDAVGQAAPKLTIAAASIGASASGIAADVKREVDEATKPKKWWQKVLGPFYTAVRLVGVFL